MGHIMASMEEMTVRHRIEIEDQRRHQEVVLADLETIHRQKIDQLVQDADQEHEVLIAKHKEEIAAALAQHNAFQQQRDNHDLEVLQLQEEVRQLRQSEQAESKAFEELKKTNADLNQQLKDTKAELEKALQQVSDLQQRSNVTNLESLTPTFLSGKNASLEESSDRRSGNSSTASTISNTSISIVDSPVKTATTQSPDERCDSNHEFSWMQFVFPMAKKNQVYMGQVRHTWDNDTIVING
jgi:chromosome segregation ATPase